MARLDNLTRSWDEDFWPHALYFFNEDNSKENEDQQATEHLKHHFELDIAACYELICSIWVYHGEEKYTLEKDRRVIKLEKYKNAAFRTRYAIMNVLLDGFL